MGQNSFSDLFPHTLQNLFLNLNFLLFIDASSTFFKETLYKNVIKIINTSVKIFIPDIKQKSYIPCNIVGIKILKIIFFFFNFFSYDVSYILAKLK